MGSTIYVNKLECLLHNKFAFPISIYYIPDSSIDWQFETYIIIP